MGRRRGAVMALAMGLSLTAGVSAGDDDLVFELELVSAIIDQPTGLVAAPGDYERVFVLQKNGRIRIIRNRSVLATPFLDISADVRLGASNGLYSVVFDPDYANNGTFYYSYMSNAGLVVERAQVSSENENIADPTTRDVLFTLPRITDQHNGGTLGFGPNDGYLYLSIGDGGPATPVPNRARNLSLLYGKMLRLDVSGDDFPGDPNRDYAIPADNPFVGTPGAMGEIWAIGLRMPWRWSFHPVTGDIYFGDVGRLGMEEVSRIPAGVGGLDFGWPCFEGTECTGFLPECDCGDPSLVEPVYSYDRSEGKCVVGGYFYDGCAIPELAGKYIFADYADGYVFTADLSADGNELENVENVTDDVVPAAVNGFLQLSSLGRDAYGELYFTEQASDYVFKVVRVDGTPVSDCNGDGEDDACQFLDGSLTDEDGNGVPDVCETTVCLGDCDDDGDVDFNDLVSMLFLFGSSDNGGCNADKSGRIDFNDLVTALFLFGPCPG